MSSCGGKKNQFTWKLLERTFQSESDKTLSTSIWKSCFPLQQNILVRIYIINSLIHLLPRKVFVISMTLRATRNTSCSVSWHVPWCLGGWRTMELAWAWSELGQAHHIHPRGPQSPLGSVPPAVGNHAPRWRREAEPVGKEKKKGYIWMIQYIQAEFISQKIILQLNCGKIKKITWKILRDIKQHSKRAFMSWKYGGKMLTVH